MNKIDVSIVIVCMNNLKNLYPCLSSIYKYTEVNYEVFVVAYLFSNKNLEKLREDYPWIKIIISSEIRGFSENNNLALKHCMGEYCMILNDDTIIDMPVVDMLIDSMKKTPSASIMSPKTLFKDGKVQSCGRPKMTIYTYYLSMLKLWKEQKIKSTYTHQKGIFQSYNIVGAAFMIKTAIFKEFGFFDEQYFFCPEDIALSTLANKRGYKCYVNPDVQIIHIGHATASMVRVGTLPASIRGSLLFYTQNSLIRKITLRIFLSFILLLRIFYWRFKSLTYNEKAYIMYISNKNSLYAIFSSKSPKEIFMKFYKK
ncbi:N-acetylglucosaminyl-diphospho-decaprenol L-rhamnosyltransferase [termite gut metagenome]|uniref:N-acetylglucosaminyl-diphospho-decaprenol L-rhamnosyltransferase n=1 Tax=termite gut metagenome TaxID=433724 RepID=A0A5J4SBA9_9ZZZZ